MDRVYLALVFVGIFSLPKAAAGGGVGPTTCRPGWTYYNSACWMLTSVGYRAMTPIFSQRHCEAMGAKLASIHSQEDQDFLATLITKAEEYHFGIFRSPEDGSLQWHDGTPMTNYTYWNTAAGNPRATGTDGYIMGQADNKWALVEANHKVDGYICRINQAEQDWSLPSRAIYQAYPYTLPDGSFYSLVSSLALAKYEGNFTGGLARCARLCAAMPGCRGLNFGAAGEGNPRCHLLQVNIWDDDRRTSKKIFVPNSELYVLRHYYPID